MSPLNTTKALFNDARVRKAALAMDREYITADPGRRIRAIPSFPKAWLSIQRILLGREPREQRLGRRALLQEAGYGPNKPLSFGIFRARQQSAHRAGAAGQLEGDRPWVQAEIRQVETKDLYKQMQTGLHLWTPAGCRHNDAYNLYLLDSHRPDELVATPTRPMTR
jgi:hypothetical protein